MKKGYYYKLYDIINEEMLVSKVEVPLTGTIEWCKQPKKYKKKF